MTTTTKPRTRFARTATAAAALAAAAVLPLSAGIAEAAAAPAAAPQAEAAQLPPGVVQLPDGVPCPPELLCLYRDYGQSGPAYGIEPGADVALQELPMQGSGGPTAANNVSSWVNNTPLPGILIDTDTDHVRPLFPGQQLEEPPATNDTVDLVHWAM